MLDTEPIANRPGLLLIADKGFASRCFKTSRGIALLRPSMKGEKPCLRKGLLTSMRRLIESVNDTLRKGTVGGRMSTAK